jgi:hypothetical protein
MSKYTKGPWWVEEGTEEDEGRLFICHSGTMCDVTTVVNIERKIDRNKEDNMANAHLIAAAPDMLAALVQAVEWIEDDRWGEDYICEEWYSEARAAIAKAKGEI